MKKQCFYQILQNPTLLAFTATSTLHNLEMNNDIFTQVYIFCAKHLWYPQNIKSRT